MTEKELTEMLNKNPTSSSQQVYDLMAEAIKRGEHPLPLATAMALPQAIDDVLARGGPTEEDWQFLCDYADMSTEKGDVLLMGGGAAGEAAELFAAYVRALSILAFIPGGVAMFGTRYQARVR